MTAAATEQRRTMHPHDTPLPALAAAMEAEQGVLSALLLDPSTAGAAVDAEGLAASDFHEPEHGPLFAAIQRLRQKGTPLNPVTLSVELAACGEPAPISLFVAVSERATPASEAGRLASFVRRAAWLRRVETQARELQRVVAAPSASDGHLHQLVEDLAETLRTGSCPASSSFRALPLHDLASLKIEPPGFIWRGLVPRNHTTVLGAHGGVGKSLVAMMFAVCVASGRPLFGVPTERTRVVFFSGEDPAEVLLHRLQWICRVLQVDPADLDGWLHVLDATEKDPALFREVQVAGQRIGSPTASYSDLAAFVKLHGIGLAVIDNMSDVDDASEIDRAKVGAFMRSLPTLRQPRLTVLLLAHVDKGTARGERAGSEGYSGSTATHNKARSRLFMARDKDGALRIEHQKCNLGPLQPPLMLRWPEGGLPELEAPLSGLLQAVARSSELRAVLRLIHEFTQRGEPVSTSINSPTSANRLLAGEPGYPKGYRPSELQALLRDAERAELLQRVEYRTHDRKVRERWSVTEAGLADLSGGAPSAPSPR